MEYQKLFALLEALSNASRLYYLGEIDKAQYRNDNVTAAAMHKALLELNELQSELNKVKEDK